MTKFCNVPFLISSILAGATVITAQKDNSVIVLQEVKDSPSPTSSPKQQSSLRKRSCSGCAPGEFRFKLEIMTDGYPDDTCWKIEDDDATSYGTNPVDLESKTLYEQEYCLPEGKDYKFTIDDAHGDGLCCAFGSGYYKGYRNDESVAIFNGGEFRSSESKTFTGFDPCTHSPTISPTVRSTVRRTFSPTFSPTSNTTVTTFDSTDESLNTTDESLNSPPASSPTINISGCNFFVIWNKVRGMF